MNSLIKSIYKIKYIALVDICQRHLRDKEICNDWIMKAIMIQSFLDLDASIRVESHFGFKLQLATNSNNLRYFCI